MALPSARTRELLELLQWPSIGVAKTRETARNVGSDEHPLEFARRRYPASARLAAASHVEITEKLTRLFERCLANEISIVSLLDDEYPERLRDIDDAPPVLFVRGAMDALRGPAVAVVGTRHASEPGKKAARRVAEYLAQRRVAVVSGLALGIDAEAHLGALQRHGVTVAILAHGLDTIAPATNRPIAERLLAEGGALVSEHPPGVPPRPAEFARRNRIQSGMSLCSVVVESAAEGGAMIQANFTRQQRRQIFAVLSSEESFNDEGGRRLISEFGAIGIHDTKALERSLTPILLRSEASQGRRAAQDSLRL